MIAMRRDGVQEVPAILHVALSFGWPDHGAHGGRRPQLTTPLPRNKRDGARDLGDALICFLRWPFAPTCKKTPLPFGRISCFQRSSSGLYALERAVA